MQKDYDFSQAKKAGEVPHLAKLQAESLGKTRITIMLDDDVLAEFKSLAGHSGMGYQTLINQTLRASLARRPVDEDMLRSVIREELASYQK